MADHFEEAMQDILLRTEGNGGPSTRDILMAIQALAKDDDEKHEENMKEVRAAAESAEKTRQALVEHIVEADERDRRIGALEVWQDDADENGEDRIRKLIAEEHARRHAEYVASMGDATFQNKLVWFFATTVGKFALVVLGIIAGIVLNLVVYGRP